MKNGLVIFSAIMVASAFLLLLPTHIPQAHAEPKYSADVPEFVKTPDKVETKSLGMMEFFDSRARSSPSSRQTNKKCAECSQPSDSVRSERRSQT